ncbi:glycosyltransferase family 39 protein [Candidatus Woesearchaeota archaeon]|nr:glycosyltransferase family 39 protein [Candidatus Woesearchaeota archaeon]
MRTKILNYAFLLAIAVLVLFPWWLVFNSIITQTIIITLLFIALITSRRLIEKHLQKSQQNEIQDISKDSQQKFQIALSMENFAKFSEDKLNLYLFVRQRWKFLTILFIVLFILHAYALTFSVLPIDDEHFHAAKGLFFLIPIKLILDKTNILSYYSMIIFFLLLVKIALIYAFYKFITKRNIEPNNYLEMLYKSTPLLIIFFIFITCYHLLAYFTIHKFFPTFAQQQFAWLIRYGPVGAIFNLILSLIGFQELFFIRLLQLFFSFSSAIVLYHIAQFYISKKSAAFAAILFLVLPSVFYFGSHAFMESGVVFFTLLSVYFFLLWHQQRNTQKSSDYLLYAFLTLLIGFFYKDAILFIFIIFVLFLLFEINKDTIKQLTVKANMNKLKDILKLYLKEYASFILLSFFFLFFTVFWLTIRNKYITQSYSAGYHFILQNILSISKLSMYAELSPLMLTYPIAIIAVFGFIFLLLKKKTPQERLLIIWIILLYLIYMLYNWSVAVPRFYIHFLPALLLIFFIFTEWLYSFFMFKKNTAKHIFYIILIILTAATTLYQTYHEIENRYWDYDNLYKFIGNNVNKDQKILFLTHDVYYYFFKYNIKNPIITENQFRASGRIQDFEQLYSYIIANNVSYIIFPNTGDLYTSVRMYSPDPSKDKLLDEDRAIILQLNQKLAEIDKKDNLQIFISGSNILYLIKVEKK